MLPTSPGVRGGDTGDELPPFILTEPSPPLHVASHDGGAPPDAPPLHNDGSGGYGSAATTRQVADYVR